MTRTIILTLLLICACHTSARGQSAYRPFPVPEGMGKLQWMVTKYPWSLNARYVWVSQTDGTGTEGFLLGAFPEG
ncbi:MAG TPA: hypothetical protein DCR93_06580 [Cytophagales bacterium]|nr:hypothetical protein [Cytophagales bacterium]